jgi:phage-related protein
VVVLSCSYGGVLFDDLNLYPKTRIIEQIGLIPPLREAIIESDEIDGAIHQNTEYDSRPFEMPCFISCDTQDEQDAKLIELMQLLWPPTDKPLILLEELPDRFINCKLNGKLTIGNDPNYFDISIPMIALDPFYYSLVEYEQSGDGTYVNAGNQDSYPVFKVVGSVIAPEIIVNGVSMIYSGTVSPSDLLVIDTKNRTIKFNGYNAEKLFNKVYISLEPGDNTISISGGTLNVIWRDCWL